LVSAVPSRIGQMQPLCVGCRLTLRISDALLVYDPWHFIHTAFAPSGLLCD
jgi:hypothetical protein